MEMPEQALNCELTSGAVVNARDLIGGILVIGRTRSIDTSPD